MDDNALSGEFELAPTTPESSQKKDITPESSDERGEGETIDNPHPVKKSTPRFYSSFCYYPKGVTFRDQEHDEEIILLIRRHFATNIPWIVSTLILLLLPPFLFPLIIEFSPFPQLSPTQAILITAFYYLIVFGFVLLKFTLWYFHVGIITNKRLKDLDILGVLYKDVAEARIDQVQDVKFDQHGFIPSIFDYGNIYIQTAGATPNIEFDKAPKPERIAQIIQNLMKKH